jgi:hypothetical protein
MGSLTGLQRPSSARNRMAKTAFISYAHESPAVIDWVSRLANRLRRAGIEADIDQFNPFPPEGWLLWMERKIETSDYVLVLCSEAYLQRSKAAGPEGSGLGSTNESQLIRLHLYKEKGINRKYIPVVLAREDRAYVPLFLQSYTQFVPDEPSDFDTLVGLMSDGAALPSKRAELQREPGFLRPWLVPLQRNGSFCERDDVLDQIARLLDDSKSASAVLFLHGLGGVGKTQCALEYCYRNRNAHTAVLWIRAEIRPCQNAVPGLFELRYQPSEQDPQRLRYVRGTYRIAIRKSVFEACFREPLVSLLALGHQARGRPSWTRLAFPGR